MKKILLSILAVSAAAVGTLGAQTPAPDTAAYFSFLTAAERQGLTAQKELTFVPPKPGTLGLGPRSPLAPILKTWGIPGATVAIEGFFLVPRPAGANPDLALYNAVNAVKTMEGLQYFSVSAQQMETLILASYRVSAQGQTQALADPVFTAIPASQKAVVFQKDNKLGDGYSELTWTPAPGGSVVVTFKNLETLKFGPLPLVDPSNLQMVFVVVPLADQVAVYGALQAKTVQLFGLERSKDESFRNRMRALAHWMGQRVATIK